MQNHKSYSICFFFHSNLIQNLFQLETKRNYAIPDRQINKKNFFSAQ